MIELLGLLYGLLKDIKAFLNWKEEEKLVDFNWPMKSGLKAKVESDGMTILWCRPDKVASRQLDGYDFVYEIDEKKRVRRKLILKDGSMLIGKRSQD